MARSSLTSIMKPAPSSEAQSGGGFPLPSLSIGFAIQSRPSKRTSRTPQWTYKVNGQSLPISTPGPCGGSSRTPLPTVGIGAGVGVAVGGGLSALVGICHKLFIGRPQIQSTTHQIDPRWDGFSPVVHLLPLANELQILTGFQSFAIQRLEGDLATLPMPYLLSVSRRDHEVIRT